MPSSDRPATQCHRQVRVTAEDGSPGITPEHQQAALQKLISLLLAKPSVQGLFWNQLSDAEPCEFAHGGLFDDQNSPKPFLDALISIRQQLLS
jgi:hypothetical protein